MDEKDRKPPKHYHCKSATITFTPKETYRIVNKDRSCMCDPSGKNDCYLKNLAYCRHIKIMSSAPVSFDLTKLIGFSDAG
jgi:hypothetical protein